MLPISNDAQVRPLVRPPIEPGQPAAEPSVSVAYTAVGGQV